MKAARLFSYDKPLKVVDVDAPRIKSPTEVLVRVTGAGVCHTDLHIVEGVWREKVQVTLPYTLGHENAGIVQEVGNAVTSFKKGEKVIVHPVMTDGTCRPCRIGEDMHCENLTFPGITADGGFAEVLRTSERSLVRIHDLAPDDVAPLADAGLTAIRAVKKAASRTTSGSHIVVMGVGGLGHIALQLLRCMTNAEIIAADVVESKLRLAEKMGAHQVVDARRDSVKQIMDITGNRGADVVIDLVGNDLTLANGMKMLHKGGTLIIVGYGGTLNVKAIDVIFSEFSVLGSLVGNWDELRELMELTRQGKIRVIAQKGKLDEVNEILEQLKKGTLEGRGVVIPRRVRPENRLRRHGLRSAAQRDLRQEHRGLVRVLLEPLPEFFGEDGLFALRVPIVQDCEQRPKDRRGDRRPHEKLTQRHEHEAYVLGMPD